MNELFNEGVRVIELAFEFLWHIVTFVFHWTFGQIIDMVHLPLATLVWWKLVLFVVSLLAIVFLIYRVATRLWGAIGRVGRAIVDLFVTTFVNAPSVLIAGLIAIACAWVVNNVSSVPFLDNFHFH